MLKKGQEAIAPDMVARRGRQGARNVRGPAFVVREVRPPPRFAEQPSELTLICDDGTTIDETSPDENYVARDLL